VSGTPLRAPATPSWVAAILLWIWRTLASILVALPVVLALDRSGLAAGPEQDAPLFRPGALLAMDVARRAGPSFAAAIEMSLVLCALCAVLGLVPIAAALDLLQTRESSDFALRFARGVRIFPGFLGLSAIALLAQAALLLGASLLSSALTGALRARDPRLISFLPFGIFALGLIACLFVGAVLDIARAVSLRSTTGARSALFEALAVARACPLSILLGVYPSAAGSLLAWLGAACLLTRIELVNRTVGGLVLAFVIHQLAIGFGLALRVRWLRTAIALVPRRALSEGQLEASLR
jgi:hypothetical protein